MTAPPHHQLWKTSSSEAKAPLSLRGHFYAQRCSRGQALTSPLRISRQHPERLQSLQVSEPSVQRGAPAILLQQRALCLQVESHFGCLPRGHVLVSARLGRVEGGLAPGRAACPMEPRCDSILSGDLHRAPGVLRASPGGAELLCTVTPTGSAAQQKHRGPTCIT